MTGQLVLLGFVVIIFVSVAVVQVYLIGVRVGSKRQLARVSNGALSGTVTMKVPLDDFACVRNGYISGTGFITLEFRRVDRAEIEVADYSKQTVGIGAFFQHKEGE